MKLNIAALNLSALITIWLIVAFAIGTEIFPPLKSSLTTLAGSHWTAKSIISLAAFLLLYATFGRMRLPKNTLAGALAVAASAVLGGILIFGFFIWHFFFG